VHDACQLDSNAPNLPSARFVAVSYAPPTPISTPLCHFWIDLSGRYRFAQASPSSASGADSRSFPHACRLAYAATPTVANDCSLADRRSRAGLGSGAAAHFPVEWA
jgi:hypothetical protein